MIESLMYQIDYVLLEDERTSRKANQANAPTIHKIC